MKIAISGKRNAGKDTLAKLIVEHMQLDKNKIIAIADPIKAIVENIFPEANKEYLYGESSLRSNIIDEKYKDTNGNPLTHRQAVIDIGEYGRRCNKDIWLNLLDNDADNYDLYVISDLRFIREYSFLKNAGFYIIRILSDNSEKSDDPTETEQDGIPNSNFNYVIYNNSTPESLSNEVKNTLITNIIEYK